MNTTGQQLVVFILIQEDRGPVRRPQHLAKEILKKPWNPELSGSRLKKPIFCRRAKETESVQKPGYTGTRVFLLSSRSLLYLPEGYRRQHHQPLKTPSNIFKHVFHILPP